LRAKGAGDSRSEANAEQDLPKNVYVAGRSLQDVPVGRLLLRLLPRGWTAIGGGLTAALRPSASALSAAAPTPARTRASRAAFTAPAAPAAPCATCRTALEDGLTARGEHRLESFDAVVRRLEEQVVDSGLGFFELPDQRLGVAARGHRPAQLRRHAVAARLSEDHELALLGWLNEVLGPMAAALAASAARRSWLRLEILRCFHELVRSANS